MARETVDEAYLGIYRELYRKITCGEYAAGDHLVEMEIAKEYQVSRTPVRLAIEKLVAEGLAKRVPNKGAVVRRMTLQEVLDLYAIREVNEGLAARLASQNVTDEDVKELNHILDEMDVSLKNEDLDLYYSLSSRIHRYIFQMSHNDFLRDFIMNIYAMTARYHVAVLHMPGRSTGSKEEHRQVVEAIISGDPELAEKTMQRHIRHSAEFFRNEKSKNLYRSMSQLDWQN